MCLGSACSILATLGLPSLTACVLSRSTLLRLQVALLGNCLRWALGCEHFPGLSRSGSGSRVLHKGTNCVWPAFCALRRSEQLRRPGAWRAHSPQVQCVLSPSRSQLLGFLGTLSQMCHVSPLESWSLAASLLADVNCPGSLEGLVSNWRPACSLVGNAVSGDKFAPFRLWLPPPPPPVGDGPVCSGLTLLWYLLSPLFCEQSGSALG